MPAVGMRKQTIARLLFTCLLLTSSSQFLDFISIKAEAIETVGVNLASEQHKSQVSMGNISASSEKMQKAERKKQSKAASRSNPIGNHHPPNRP